MSIKRNPTTNWVQNWVQKLNTLIAILDIKLVFLNIIFSTFLFVIMQCLIAKLVEFDPYTTISLQNKVQIKLILPRLLGKFWDTHYQTSFRVSDAHFALVIHPSLAPKTRCERFRE